MLTFPTVISTTNRIISLLVVGAALVCSASASAQQLKPDAPDRYVVQRGDTLWNISNRYLSTPWQWPQLWNMNRSQVRNPHLIYPGDVLVLDRASGRLRIENASLSPRVRTEEITESVPTISQSAIAAFVSRPMVLGENELDSAPRIMATEESRVAVGAGNTAYVKGLSKDKGIDWQIYRRGDKMVDPDTGTTLGYFGLFLGDARVQQFGDISRIEILNSTQEIYVGDRLVPVVKQAPVFDFVPRAPAGKMQGRIVSLPGNLYETGRYFVVSLSKGAKDGLEVGNVVALYRSPTASRYSTRTGALFGRTGPSGSDARRPYHEEQLNVRDAPLYNAKPTIIDETDIAKIPNERYGLVMVFRTFERIAFGLVMQADLPVAIDDIFTNP